MFAFIHFLSQCDGCWMQVPLLNQVIFGSREAVGEMWLCGIPLFVLFITSPLIRKSYTLGKSSFCYDSMEDLNLS